MWNKNQSGNPAGRPVSLDTLVTYFRSANRLADALCDAAADGDEEALRWLRKAYAERDLTIRPDDGHGGFRV